MMILTLTQPFATLVAAQDWNWCKRLETRSWATSYRGPLAIHAYSPGRYAWLLADVRRLREPLPYRGAQGLRPLPTDVITLVEALAVSSGPPAR